jgi:hypothetical protein
MAKTTQSAQMAAALGVLRTARGPLTTGQIAQRMADRSEPCAAVSTLLSNLRRSPDLAALGYTLPQPVRETRHGRPTYLYRLEPLQPNTQETAA